METSSDPDLIVLHVLASLDAGGVETWLKRILTQEDCPKGFRHAVLLTTTHVGIHEAPIRGARVRVFRCVARSRTGMLLKLHSELCRIRPAIVHSHVGLASGFILLAALVAGVPGRVAHAHNVCPSVGGFRRRVYEALSRIMLRNASTLKLACSDEAGKSVFAAADFYLQPYAVDVAQSSVRQRRHRDSSVVRLGMVASFTEQKNHRFAVNMIDAAKKGEQRFVLHLAGSGRLESEVRALVRELDLTECIEFHGLTPDPQAWIGRYADVLIVPSFFEGLGLVVWEALSVNVPVLASTNVPAVLGDEGGWIVRLPLSDGPYAWLTRARQLSAAVDYRPTPGNRIIQRSGLSPDVSMARLHSLYRRALP